VSESFHIVFAHLFAITENYFTIISFFIQYYFFENLAQYIRISKNIVSRKVIYRGC